MVALTIEMTRGKGVIMYKTIAFLTFCAFLCIICACISHRNDFSCEELAIKVFKQDTRIAREREFEKIEDVDTQFCVYMYGMTAIHPPIMMEDSIAKNPAIVPFLKKKLRETDDDAELWSLYAIIPYLKTSQGYSIENDKELMDIMKSAINRVKNQDNKKSIIDMLEHASINIH